MLISVTASRLECKAVDDISYVLKRLPIEIAAYQEQLAAETSVQIELTINGFIAHAPAVKKPVPAGATSFSKYPRPTAPKPVLNKTIITFDYTLGNCTGEQIVTDIETKLQSMRHAGFVHSEPKLAEVETDS